MSCKKEQALQLISSLRIDREIELKIARPKMENIYFLYTSKATNPTS